MKLFLLSTVINGGAQAAQSTGEAAAQGATQAASAGGSGGIMFWVIYVVGLVALFYFFAIRPQKKREKEAQTLQASIAVGDTIITTCGFYGRVVDIQEACFIIEFGTNKGVRIPVNKRDVLAKSDLKF